MPILQARLHRPEPVCLELKGRRAHLPMRAMLSMDNVSVELRSQSNVDGRSVS